MAHMIEIAIKGISWASSGVACLTRRINLKDGQVQLVVLDSDIDEVLICSDLL